MTRAPAKMGTMKTAALLCTAVALALTGAAHANILYKSVSPNGVVMFSDSPPEGAGRVEVITMAGTSGNAPAIGASRMPVSRLDELVSSDDALARANARVDQAEAALAQARRGLWSPRDGLQLVSHNGNSSAREVDSFKRDVLLARQNLLETLQARTRR